MKTVINLNKARKTRDRDADKARADANAARFGRTKAERQAEAARAEKAARDLDGHRRE
ncbi:DUF4169 family protein [Jannaschia pohangensis]|uniref:DUF4169 domain-containing protein n=1 Tax=Jannaschia pohangensis TaxID=390807 RepID=A0A1I3HIZ2_9RHOB|nr:DUF4169 family protein [Jannaschia pohangensis]SFI35589.1 protein of unknown function [Jannaschia pohangensis]